MDVPKWLCLWSQGCLVVQYVSAMKVSVGVNLLAGVWIWLHKQSDQVHRRINSKVGGIVGVVEDQGADLKSGIRNIGDKAEQAVRRIAMRGIVGAAVCTFLILLVAFFVRGDQAVTGFWSWLLALALALAGPLVMLWTYLRIGHQTRCAVDEATTLVNTKAKELGTQKPPPPDIPVPNTGDPRG